MDTKGKMMISCKEATFLISKKQQDKLTRIEKIQLTFHLMMCKYCRRFERQTKFITKAIKKMNRRVEKQGVPMQMTDAQKQQLRQKLNEANR
ncbi:anti-sigma factor family protein [Carboxylicivirga marina]|uniref:Zf-HC2 domain-containing protein n=1 Tax=Carboxylicivirga marina TaxID=2800988 RepID=A0ABS1HNU6_9BACT|nr:hypothetical protein [Carboxylicivirga marina]MBK3519316.1 hypothetical protein [Carboxylicivirga marina]